MLSRILVRQIERRPICDKIPNSEAALQLLIIVYHFILFFRVQYLRIVFRKKKQIQTRSPDHANKFW